ncbi:MAG TPA: nitronate monooxygenase family protein [Rhodocyclaceae bacterium]|nr:nitronate monooxygenase family protein [Rhodocyclaceae bacterium]HNA02619.1 nitronate monooxygenase family protein [Rhodocyclaceae bacterium]HNB77114.1 nitronate monooxygenase family protein [Rhodocyclaceae bacterium]HNC62467.1 nitronate monooxygenase family protein [Rhodocyclaceae bacterium]HNH12818.1 nitronate monooxygenase family protein [Rhodocyclaceae bacterium]
MRRSPLPSFNLRGRSLLPIVQGGMGVGVSAHRLAGSVAALGAVGTIASVDLRRLHPDLMEATGRSRSREEIEEANLTALEREIGMAREIAQGRGAIAVNVMRAVSQYVDYVSTAGRAGADAVVMGAGLPLDLPDIAADFPNLALMPILSDARGVSLLLKKWMRKNRLPDAIVIEHPGHAGGHLGAAKVEDLTDPRFDFDEVLPGILQVYRDLGLESERIPLIAAGGINSHEQAREVLALGASAVQLGTAFAVTEEGDAHELFKRVLADARPEDIVEFTSVAGLPARAVRTPWLENYLRREHKLQAAATLKEHKCTLAWDCLIQCGLRDGLAKFGQFCIDNQLAAAVRGDYEKGLFFRGKQPLPFGSAIRPVRELVDYLLTGVMPVGLPQPAAALAA